MPRPVTANLVTANPITAPRATLAVVLSIALSGCSGSIIDTFDNFHLVHRIDIGQGHYIEQATVDQLKPGMSKRQVQFLMGLPNLQDPFHADRWDYIHRYQHANGGLYDKRITLFFKDDKLSQITGNLKPGTPDPNARLARQQSVDVPPQQHEQGLLEGALSAVGLDTTDQSSQSQ